MSMLSTEAVTIGPRMEVTPPVSPQNRPASNGLATPPRDQSLAERMRTDTCFKCQKQGHWAKDCPSKTPIKRSQPSDTDLPVIQCPHGHGSCSVQTSSSEKNPNRKYYECPRKRTGGCDFFKWFDEMILPERIPVCVCGAGKCCVDRVKVGPNAGRWFFTCRVQKGHGACQFFLWEDAQTTGNNCGVANTVNGGLDRGDAACSEPSKRKKIESGDTARFEPSKRMKIESSMMSNNHQSPNLVSTPGPSAAVELPPTGSLNQKLQTVARSLDFSAAKEIALDAETGPIILDNARHASRLSEPVICPQQLPGEVSIAKAALIGGTRFTAVNHRESSGGEEDVVKSLKNSILSLLEFKCSQDRVSLERLVNPILDVLDGLTVDNKLFRENVGEFIRCASSLTQYEQAIGSKPTLQDVIDRYNHEKDRVNDISRKHAEALYAFNASNGEAHRLKDMLIQIRNQLSCCETETLKLKTRVDEICKEKMECERSLQTAEEALRVSRKKEEELVAAKESFEKAKNQLQHQ